MTDLAGITNIVIVDDHPLFSDGLMYMLNALSPGAHVEAFPTLATAVEALQGDLPCDLILLDLALPDAQGFESLIRLREVRPDAAAVVLSGVFEPRLVIQCLDHGAAGFIPKTASQRRTIDALQTVVEGGIYVPEEAAVIDGIDARRIREMAMRRRAAWVADGSPEAGPDMAGEPESGIAAEGLDGGRYSASGSGIGALRSTDPRSLGLTSRQIDVLRLMLRGLPNKLICRQLELAEGTVKVHVSAVLRALGVRNRTQAVIAASQLGLRLSEAR